jgi:hypothetical protein
MLSLNVQTEVLSSSPVVAVYIVTYRRPHLLRRAIESVLNQKFTSWDLRVVNDDPDDCSVLEVIREFDDARIRLHEPLIKRGAAGSFNEAYKAQDCEFSSLLEDDNWWEPHFLEVMVKALRVNHHIALACSNERIWTEAVDGTWCDTGKLVWPSGPDALFATDYSSACGSAKLCNSSMLIRRRNCEPWLTPDDIPVDVTEHFRERVVPQPILLINEALVNYAETLHTHRARSGSVWADYQALLIGSIFASSAVTDRRSLAERLLERFDGKMEPRVTSMLFTALVIPEARDLLRVASAAQLLSFVVTLIRRFGLFVRLRSVRQRCAGHWEWLLASRFNQAMR